MNAGPAVSVGLPVFNGENYLVDCLDSLRAQDHDDFELIVSDNASTDATEAICREAAAEDHRIRYHRMKENRGVARNYNRVFEMSRGRYFSWTAHDDRRARGFLSGCVGGFAESDPTTVLVYPRAEFVDRAGNVIGPDTDDMSTDRSSSTGRLRDALWHVNMAHAVFGLIRADALRRTRLIGPFVASDYVLLAELAMLGPIVEIPQVLSWRRLHEASSRESNISTRDVQAWFDPSRAKAPLSTKQRLWIEYTRSAWRLTPSTAERLASVASVPQVMLTRQARVVGGRWKQRLLGAGDDATADRRTDAAPDRD